MFKKFYLFIYLFFNFNFNFIYSNEEVIDENIFDYVESNNELLDLFRKNSRILLVSEEEKNLYKEKLKFFENFFEKKINLSEENLNKRIILIKENLLNEKVSEIKESVNFVFKDNVSHKDTIKYLINQSNILINNNDLIEKKSIIESLKNSDKIEEIQNLIKKYKDLDLNTEKNLDLINKNDEKNKKLIFKSINAIFIGINIFNFVCFPVRTFGFIKEKIKPLEKFLNDSTILEDLILAFKGKCIATDEDLDTTAKTAMKLNYIDQILNIIGAYREKVGSMKITFEHSDLNTSYYFIKDSVSKKSLKNTIENIEGLSTKLLNLVDKSSIFLFLSKYCYFSYFLINCSSYFYTFFQNYKLVKDFEKNILLNYNKKIEISKKIKELIENECKNKNLKLKEFKQNIFDKNINSNKKEINNIFKNDFYNKYIRMTRNEYFAKDKFLENNKKYSIIFNYDFKENKFFKVKNNSIYMLDNFINFSDSLVL